MIYRVTSGPPVLWPNGEVRASAGDRFMSVADTEHALAEHDARWLAAYRTRIEHDPLWDGDVVPFAPPGAVADAVLPQEPPVDTADDGGVNGDGIDYATIDED